MEKKKKPRSPPPPEDKPLNLRQQRFVDAYLRTGILCQAVQEAGYSAKSDKGRSKRGSELMHNPAIQRAIRERAQVPGVAQKDEILLAWTKWMRGQEEGFEAKDRVKSSELLAKAAGFLIKKTEVSGKIETGPAYDYDKLTMEEMQELRRLLEKARVDDDGPGDSG